MTHEKFFLFGLIIQCPLGARSLVDCPLNKYRVQVGLQEKFDYVCKLDSLLVEEIMETHYECFQNRWGNILNIANL